MAKKMVATCIDEMYSFDELEEYAQEMILYDIRTTLDISEEEALEIAKEKQYNYCATINYEL